MIRIDEVEVCGWRAAVRGMRNPMNSWEKSDSFYYENDAVRFCVGPDDKELMLKLAKNGPVHAKYRRMITVHCDILAPLYWWKEFDTYQVGTVRNSCSTMHKIHEKEFEFKDFSTEHLLMLGSYNGIVPAVDIRFHDEELLVEPSTSFSPTGWFCELICLLNKCRELYLKTKDKVYWWQMIQLLPSSYNQKRTVQLNYEVLSNIYISRKDHKLDEWREFCNWIKTLPYSEIITLEEH